MSGSMRLLNVDELAAKLGCTRQAALKLDREDKSFPIHMRLTAGKYDGLRWRECDVDNWIELQFAEQNPVTLPASERGAS